MQIVAMQQGAEVGVLHGVAYCFILVVKFSHNHHSWFKIPFLVSVLTIQKKNFLLVL